MGGGGGGGGGEKEGVRALHRGRIFILNCIFYIWWGGGGGGCNLTLLCSSKLTFICQKGWGNEGGGLDNPHHIVEYSNTNSSHHCTVPWSGTFHVKGCDQGWGGGKEWGLGREWVRVNCKNIPEGILGDSNTKTTFISVLSAWVVKSKAGV